MTFAIKKENGKLSPMGKPRAGEHTFTDVAVAHAKELDALRERERELVEALEKLVELGDHVPVFQLDDGKSSVKAVRLAGKFMGVMAAARALLAKHGR